MTTNGNPVCIRVENSYHAKGSKRLFNFQVSIQNFYSQLFTCEFSFDSFKIETKTEISQ